MNASFDLEQQLRVHFEARADRSASDGQFDAILERTAGLGQRPAWLAALRSPTMSATSIAVRPAIPRQAWLLIAVGVLALLVAAAVFVGRPQQPKPPLNGLIVFGRMNEALGDTVVYTIHPDGTNETQVRPETHEGPFWSPDGKLLGLGHAVSNADGSGYRVWDQSGNPFHLECWDWSPDGQRMLCEGFSDDVAADARIHGVYTARASDGGDIRRVSPEGGGGVPLSYSPDGKSVLWYSPPAGTDTGPLHLSNPDGTNDRRLGAIDYNGATWAPDGRSVLVWRDGRLYSLDIATGSRTAVRPRASLDAQIWGAQYSPDGTRILFRRWMYGDNFELFTILADGTDLVRLTNTPEEERFMDWGTHPLG